MSDVWDDLARDLDGLHDPPGSLPDKVHRRLRSKLLDWAAALPPGATVLDLGCGSGKLSRELLQRRPDLKLLGMDASPGMLELAQASTPGAENPRWILGDARQWPLEDASVDAVMALDLAAHLDGTAGIPAVLAEAHRVCSGWMLLEIKNPWSLRLLLLARRLLDAVAPRKAREFALGLKLHAQRIPIHVHVPKKILAAWPGCQRLAPWPWLPSPSQIYVLRMGGKR